MIVGGWEFVWAAYGITWFGLSFYAISLMVRRRRLDELAQEASTREGEA